MSRDRQFFDVRAARYGPNLPPQGYYVDICYLTFYIGTRPGWGWKLPKIWLINTKTTNNDTDRHHAD